MSSNSRKKSSRPKRDTGLPWPNQYKSLLPVIRKDWGITDDLYLNRMLSGGRSGALVYVADLNCEGFQGQAILKLDTANPSDWSEDEEFESHKIAVAAAPEYASRHLPQLLHAVKEKDQIAILSTIAGRGLEYAIPWAECPYKQQLEFGRRVSGDLLEEWNADYRIARGLLEPQALLEHWLGYRLDPEEGRIGSFLAECGIDPNEPSFSFQGEWYPNPLAFATRLRPLPKKTHLRAARGQSHGDLHGRNILIASPPRGGRQYYLIDLDLYRRDDFLFYDHAYLEFTHLLQTREETDADRWKSILDNLSRFHTKSEKQSASGDDLGLLKLLGALRTAWLTWVDRHEPNRLSNMESQYLLARIAVGLTFTHRGLPLHGRCMAFTYAAANLKDYLQLNGVDWPKNGPELAFPNAATKTSAPARQPPVKAPTTDAAAVKSTPTPGRPNRWWIPVAAVLLLALGIGGLAWWLPWTDLTSSTASDDIDMPKMEELSIAVLPFRVLGHGEQAETLAHGMQASLTTSLDEVPQLVVVWNQLPPASEAQIDTLSKIGRELKVRYVLDGSVQQNQDRIRVIAKLVDVASGRFLWSKRFDRKTKDIFVIQDEIALEVLVALQVKLTEGLQAALRSQHTKSLDAFLLYAKGQELYRDFSRESMREVRSLMDQALKLDPNFSSAMVLKAKTYVADARLGFAGSDWESLTKASRILNEAAAIDGRTTDAEQGEIHAVDGYIDLLARRFNAAKKTAEKAVELVPDNADVAARFGSILFYTGDYDRAIRMVQRAMRLSPLYPAWYSLYLSRAYAYKGEIDEAIKWGRDGVRRAKAPHMRAVLYANLAFVYWEAGQHDNAKNAARKALESDPEFNLTKYSKIQPFEKQEDWQHMVEAMRSAGLPG